jgi:hypothetical protein
MNARDRRGAVAFIYLASLMLVAIAGGSLAIGMFASPGGNAVLIALVASVGGLLLLGLGALRSSGRRPSGG